MPDRIAAAGSRGSWGCPPPRQLPTKVISLSLWLPCLSLSAPLPPPCFGASAATGIGGKTRRDRARLGQRELGGWGKPVFGKREAAYNPPPPRKVASGGRQAAGRRLPEAVAGLAAGSWADLSLGSLSLRRWERLPPPAGNPASSRRLLAAPRPGGDSGSPARTTGGLPRGGQRGGGRRELGAPG